jgi:hypothetical protein
VAVAVVSTGNGSHRPPGRPTPAPSVGVGALGRPLLPGRGGWELLARGDRVIVRIDLARGAVSSRRIPEIGSTGPTAFIAGPDWTMVRPSDFVTGYLIPDRGPVRPLAGLLDEGGLAYPGPDPDSVWALAGGSRPERMVRVGLDGSGSGLAIPVPTGGSPDAVPDQAGNLLFRTAGGWYDAGPARTTHVTGGDLLAVGPTRWLTSRCDRHRDCTTLLIDRSDGTRRKLDLRLRDRRAPPGVISPDGRFAVRLLDAPRPALELIDLDATALRRIAVPIDPFAALQRDQPVWSPDSRWFFVTDVAGRLDAVNPRSGRVVDLSARLGPAVPPVSQLALRMDGSG